MTQNGRDAKLPPIIFLEHAGFIRTFESFFQGWIVDLDNKLYE